VPHACTWSPAVGGPATRCSSTSTAALAAACLSADVVRPVLAAKHLDQVPSFDDSAVGSTQTSSQRDVAMKMTAPCCITISGSSRQAALQMACSILSSHFNRWCQTVRWFAASRTLYCQLLPSALSSMAHQLHGQMLCARQQQCAMHDIPLARRLE
jgi:hypothetical protein